MMPKHVLALGDEGYLEVLERIKGRVDIDSDSNAYEESSSEEE